MDLLRLIRSKIITFEGTTSQQGLEAVIHHIEIAENHFEQSKQLGEYLLTDVIYRTNHAFEGALKEAYRVLNGSDPSELTPYKIEKHLETAGVLKERVLSQLTNYRTEWRNKSTHDYQLFFSSQEAILAIVSISAFFSILLDQMIEKRFYNAEKAQLSNTARSLFSDVPNYESMSFFQQCVELVSHFSAQLRREESNKGQMREYELLGKLWGFIAAADPQIQISTEKQIDHASGHLLVDMLLERGNESVILELKRSRQEWARRAREGVEQLRHYLIASKLSHGIVFIPTLETGQQQTVKEQSIEAPHGKLHIAIISPSRTKV